MSNFYDLFLEVQQKYNQINHPKPNRKMQIYSYLNQPHLPLFEDDIPAISNDSKEIDNNILEIAINSREITNNIPEISTNSREITNNISEISNDSRGITNNIGEGAFLDTTYRYITTSAELAENISPYLKAEVIGIDTETTGLDPYQHRIRLVQIASVGLTTLVLDCFRVNLQELAPLLASDGVKIFHNAAFDLKFFTAASLEVEGKIFDTQISYQLLHLGKEEKTLKSNLKDVVKRYLDLDIDKSNQKSDWGAYTLTEEQLKYAALDASVLPLLREKLKLALLNLNLQDVAKLEFDCTRVTAHMELNGMLLDASKWEQEVTSKLEALKTEAEEKLKVLLPNPSNPFNLPDMELNYNSPAQVTHALNAMGINVKSTGVDTLLKHLDQHRDVIKALLDYRTLEKGLTTYGNPYLKHLNPITGRLHTSFKQLKSTGRYSSTNPNIQNIPRDPLYRSCFIPAPGYKLVQCDYGQMELRIAAEIYDEPKMIKAFKEGADIHRLTASAIYNIPPDQVTKEQRSIAKTANFGLLYGSSYGKFKETALQGGVVLTDAEAKHVVDSFFKMYQGFAKAKAKSRSATAGLKTSVIRTLGGRLMNIGYGGSYIGNQYLNYPIQGLCADITKLALVKLLAALKPYHKKAKIIAMIHDEILVEAALEIAPEVKDILATAMREAAETYLKKVPIETDAKICDSWADK